ncbi:MAG TPA: flagellar FlbD family protein [Polyangia bacterium]|nr:flagellar FlbD family protein [Polyangia bacterium]
MIHVTRLDGTDVVVNADLIATIERTPDTMLALVTGARLMVRESVEEVVERVVNFRRRTQAGPLVLPDDPEIASLKRNPSEKRED